MAKEHWFDSLSVLLTRHLSRRGLLQAAAALGAGLGFNLVHRLETTAKGAKNRRRRKKKKPTTGPRPRRSCSRGACAAVPEWAGKQGEIDYCELICRQCDGKDPREFCIRDGVKPNGTSTKVAVCCKESQTCCGGECCGSSDGFPSRHCCGGKTCCPGNTVCCGDRCGPPPNDPHLRCCDGRLYDTRVNASNCGACGNACDPGEVCRNGACECEGPECTCFDRNCPEGQRCFTSTRQTCSGDPSGDCQCGCGGFNYCEQPEGGWRCQSNPC